MEGTVRGLVTRSKAKEHMETLLKSSQDKTARRRRQMRQSVAEVEVSHEKVVDLEEVDVSHGRRDSYL